MKKVISFLILLCVCLGMFTSCEQEKSFDSVNLPEQVYSNFENPEYFIVKACLSIRLYDIYDDEIDIKSLFDESKYMQGAYYFSQYKENAEGYFMYYDKDGKFNYYPTSAAEKDYNDFLEYARYPEKALGVSTRVENMYCFVNGNGYTEWWILYETKNGPDYVLLKEQEGREKIYLFTYEELEPMAMALREYRRLNADKDGIPILSNVADISEYEITPSDMTKVELKEMVIKWCALGIAITAVTAASLIIIVKARKKTVKK